MIRYKLRQINEKQGTSQRRTCGDVGINVTQSFQMHDVALSVFSFGNLNIISGSRKS